MLNRRFRNKYSQISRRSTAEEKEVLDFKLHLPFVALILYVTIIVATTTDEALLKDTAGIRLPLIGANVSAVGFYLVAPIMILVAHLVTSKKLTSQASRISKFSTRPTNAVRALDYITDSIFTILLLGAAPATLYYSMFRFAAYQHRLIFFIQLSALGAAFIVSIIRYRQIFRGAKWKRGVRSIVIACTFSILIPILICIDVIFVPVKYSLTMWLKENTFLLHDEDYGTIPLIPHLKIDRATKLWGGKLSSESELARYNGSDGSRSQFMNREVTLDLRGRRLRFLDIQAQTIPRIWAHDADLSGANLSFSRLYGSIFINTKLAAVELQLSQLDGSVFMNTTIENGLLSNASLGGTYWENVDLIGTLARNSDFFLATFVGTTFINTVIAPSSLMAVSIDSYEAIRSTVPPMRTGETPIPIFAVPDAGQTDLLPFTTTEKDLVEAIIRRVCLSGSHVAAEYAWNNFIGLQVIQGVHRENSEKRKVLARILAEKNCSQLDDRGMRQLLSQFNK